MILLSTFGISRNLIQSLVVNLPMPILYLIIMGLSIYSFQGGAINPQPIEVVHKKAGSKPWNDTEGQRSFQLPVTWEVTRARFDDRGHSSDSESFEELWRLQINADSSAVLHSSRESVPVFSIVTLHQSIVAVTITEANLARLTGLFAEGSSVIAVTQKNFTIKLDDRNTVQDVTLNLTDEEHLAVRVAAGSLHE